MTMNKLDIIGEICLKYDIDYEINIDKTLNLVIKHPDYLYAEICQGSSLQCLYDEFYEYLRNKSKWKDKIKEDFPCLLEEKKEK